MKKVLDENVQDVGAEPPVPNPDKFTKEAILKSKRWEFRRDALSVLLKDGEEYTHQDIENILNDFMKGQVK